MPSFVVKQPNGRYAMFHTVTDGFGAFNYTYADMLARCQAEWGLHSGLKKMERADAEEECTYSHLGRGTYLHRWRACLDHMANLGGKFADDAATASVEGNNHPPKDDADPFGLVVPI